MGDLEMKWTNLEKVLEEYAIELRNKYQDYLINSDRLASGELLNNVEYDFEKDNMHFAVVLKLADYWKYVEYDTKPHWPPFKKNSDGTIESPILDWIQVKPILPDNRFGKLPTPEQLTYLIGRKISEEGTEGSYDLHSAIEDINTEFMEKIEEAITKDVDETATVIFTEFFKK